MAKHWWVGSRSWRLAGRQSPVAAGPRRRTTGTLTAIGSTMVEPGWLDQEQHLQCLNYANYPLNLMDDSAFCAGHAQLFHERANGTRTSLWSKSKFEKQEIIFTVIQLLALVLGRSGSGWVLVSLGWIAYQLGISFKTMLPKIQSIKPTICILFFMSNFLVSLFRKRAKAKLSSGHTVIYHWRHFNCLSRVNWRTNRWWNTSENLFNLLLIS